MKTKTFILLILILVSIDILIKIFIEYNCMETSFDILPPYLSFYPIYNMDYSYINHMFGLGMVKSIHLAIATIIILLLFLYYDFTNYIFPNEQILPLALSLGISAALCNVIGVVFFGGVLDYISLNGYFVFDLKDVYIVLFIILLLYRSYKRENREKLKLVNITEYLRYRFSNSKNK